MLGRLGLNRPNIKVADFRYQPGIYVLYGNHGAYYVGLAKKLGSRLKDHTTDHHTDWWDKFSWFGFCSVLKKTDNMGISQLGKQAEIVQVNPKNIIAEIEAILIKVLNTSNVNQQKFRNAKQWEQIKALESEDFLDKVVS
ncbi:MAG: GIY-YIG nuclease family protein [SAR324 cluster bacterium]|nr:GIY-YIG nuclease family protein [SAR324 cluster bacterium]